jgi:hypothetical protein
LICREAARAGHWNIVVWAVQNEVPMEDDYFNLCEFAAEHDRWDIVKLAVDNGCSCPSNIQQALMNHRQ